MDGVFDWLVRHGFQVMVWTCGVGAGLCLLGLAHGGYWAIALAIGGPKVGPVILPHLVNGIGATAAGTMLLVSALRWPTLVEHKKGYGS